MREIGRGSVRVPPSGVCSPAGRGTGTENTRDMSFMYLALIFAGGIAGILAGFMGIGGGAVLTPICLAVYPALGVDGPELVKVIFGTNMLLAAAFSLSSAVSHHRNGRMDWRAVLLMGPAAILGAIAGSSAAAVSNPLVLRKAFALLLIAASTLIVTTGSTKPAGHEGNPRLSRRFLPVLGLVTGVVGSFLGIGGGIIAVPVLILLFAFPVSLVAGTSSAVIVFAGCAGTIAYMFTGHITGMTLPGWSTGYVWWSAAIPLALGGVPMAMLGASLNARTRAKTLQRIFGAVLFVIAVKILLT